MTTLLVISIYLLSLVAFAVAGITILIRDVRLSRLQIARCIWLLALFCLVHAAYDSLKLVTTVATNLDALNDPSGIERLRYPLLALAYLALALFGVSLQQINRSEKVGADAGASREVQRAQQVGFVLGVAMLMMASLAIGTEKPLRYGMAWLAGLIAGLGLINYSRKIVPEATDGSRLFRYAGGVLILLGLLSSLTLTLSGGHLFTYSVLIARAACAAALMILVLRAMSLFDKEQLQIIEERLARFAESEKLTALGRLAAGIAHEVNNPLTNALLNAELLREALPAGDPGISRLDVIEKNLSRAARIAQELLYVSRQSEHEELDRVCLSDIVQRAIYLIQAQEFTARIDLEPSGPVEVEAVPWRLEEVVINLLMNAIDACPDQGGQIRIRITRDAGIARLMVSDNGTGIEPNDRARIFEPFFTTKDPGKGTGLGLSVCHRIVRDHGGEISVQGRPGGGSVFTVSLPLAEPSI